MLSRKGKASSFRHWGPEEESDDEEVCKMPLPGDEELLKPDTEQAVNS